MSVNFELTVKLLNQSVTKLLENRRLHGVLLPNEGESINKAVHKLSQNLSCEQVLLEKEYLVITINKLCLTEAVLVRDNFSNCLEFITERKLQKSSSSPVKHSTASNSNDVAIGKVAHIARSNISPIRLTEIRQKLAHALEPAETKKERVKSTLNKLAVAKKPAKKSILPKIKTGIKTKRA
ncbi:hypothetical protein ND2E_0439 [Colwellia psychrerythraea]|uniref:Uncharacterized protein n=1 Tax=Colwellia psychrerythraea TaxID=28229 RepID=A0A099KAC9_COLPS|nr:hypothetical protein ND2E_0439 [Colwellia psychrerythraea]